MPHTKPSPLHFEILAAVALASCVSGRPSLELPPNPPGCESVVQRHKKDPGLAVDSPPKPMGILIPPVTNLRAEPERIIITFLVDETGVPVPGKVLVSGAKLPATKRALTEGLQDWRFIPARVGECWVPAPFSYQLTMGYSWITP